MEGTGLRRAVAIVAILNFAYFGIEFAVATAIQSVSLFADSIDFLEDTALNLLIFLGLAWTARNRARLGMVLAVVLLMPGAAALWTAWQKIVSPTIPDPFALSWTGAGAMAVNLACAFILVRYRHHSGSLTRAAFLSARNDALANVGIIVAGILTFLLSSVWPDLVVGLAIAAINADAAIKVFGAARAEHAEADISS